MMISDWNDFVWDPTPKTKCLPMPIEEEIALWREKRAWKSLAIILAVFIALLFALMAKQNYQNGGSSSDPSPGEIPAIYSTPEPTPMSGALRLRWKAVPDMPKEIFRIDPEGRAQL